MSGRAPAMLLVALALAVGGCGSDDDGGAQSTAGAVETTAGAAASDELLAAVARDYEIYVRDIYAGRWKDACAGYSDAYVKSYPSEIGLADTCVGTMKLEFAGLSADGGGMPEVTAVEPGDQDEAVAIVTRADGNDAILDMVREDGRWRIDGLSERHRERARTRTSPPDPVPLESR